ncbi:DUF4351 domain-containing protein [Thiohalocapsa marina]|uniref:DUF4351 domain-containing protein n=1 Tax=Thiohalocapsa marina TaxID=424902 RepID=A0A5M8FSI1_9GAMM|nr:DUF4351 domain-containing protein [Thiohalocapsa marina]KAA6185102.1 DUF4351 domain-containing protein [Thiohalocapsa marina]
MDHDQNFKNLILDYPREALALFAAAEAQAIDVGARILPIREEQLKERLGERFRELDVPLLVEWPDGRRAALLFVLEEETDPKRFSIHRLAHYCLDLAELYGTDRVVPVVIFLHPGDYPERLELGSEQRGYLQFSYLHTALFRLRAREYLDSDNLVARLALPTMAFAPEEKFEVIAAATRGLTELEPDPERRLKYADFIDIYAMLDENEWEAYRQRYPQEATTMTGFAARFTEQGRQLGHQQGLEQGLERETTLVLRLLKRRLGRVADHQREHIQSLPVEQIETLGEDLLDFTSPADLEAWLARH